MSQAMKNFSATLVLWRLALGRLGIHLFMVVAGGYLGAMGNQHWADLDGDSRFKMLLGLALTGAGTILAFLDKTAAKIAQGQLTPPDLGDTVQISKSGL